MKTVNADLRTSRWTCEEYHTRFANMIANEFLKTVEACVIQKNYFGENLLQQTDVVCKNKKNNKELYPFYFVLTHLNSICNFHEWIPICHPLFYNLSLQFT